MTDPLIFAEEIREIEIDCPGDVFALDVSEKPRFDLQCELEGIKALGLDTSPGCSPSWSQSVFLVLSHPRCVSR